MTLNQSGRDRVVRILGGAALGYVAWTMWPGILSVTILVIASIALVTGVAGWCPGYSLFNVSTRKRVAH